MNAISPTTTEAQDNLDRLLAQFFKGEMARPWPAAPATRSATAEPSVLVAARNEPTLVRDHGSKSRYTLAASVALLLGTCWSLSNGFQSGNRPHTPGRSATPTIGAGMLGGTSASNPEMLKSLQKDNALKDAGGPARPKIELP